MTNEKTPPLKFMTVGEVADLMRVSSMTVYRLIKAGDLRAVQVGKSYRIREEDINSFIASRYNQTG
ncbi:MAG TPA: helix-turn-helix domain-containing protein [Acidimicrobiales bacterium]|jgi:excisionase family DNA binding protein|nr:helix-turn-helix domain-containing protein [Actinomycetota bacterium]HJM98983.1 helix-turn-helix domain-containing protein [Acidimicrobiales bacterium]